MGEIGMKIRKIMIVFLILVWTVSAFSAIGYEHFTVREQQAFTDLLVRLSRSFKGVQDTSDWKNNNLLETVQGVPFSVIVEMTMAKRNVDVVVTDISGTILYDADATEIGRNTLTDPLYQNFPELLELFEQHISVEASGEGMYSFYADDLASTIEKHVMWNTLNAFGTEIKVCMNTR